MPNDRLEPNWEYYSGASAKWKPIFVDSMTGKVTSISTGQSYSLRWGEFSESFKVRKIMKETNKIVKPDNVNSPSHYGSGKIECIDYIEDFLTKEEFIGYLRGNIAKYMHRWRYKNKAEDLKKAEWYLKRLIKTEETK